MLLVYSSPKYKLCWLRQSPEHLHYLYFSNKFVYNENENPIRINAGYYKLSESATQHPFFHEMIFTIP